MSDFEEVSRQIEELINSRKGMAGTGGVFGVLAGLQNGSITLEPGDFSFGEGRNEQATTAPIYYDLWYLWNHRDLITKITKDQTTYVDEYLDFLANLEGLKPLKMVQLGYYGGIWIGGPGLESPMRSYNEGPYFIHEMAYEMWLLNNAAKYSSSGPPNGNINDYVGYLAFPVGQAGVMEVLSIVRQSDMEKSDFGPEYTDRVEVQSPPELFPPPWGEVRQNECYGRHLIEYGYVVPDEEAAHVEILAEDYGPGIYFHESIAPKRWIRFWIHNEDTFPIPGEFVAILARPQPVPPHVWWYQESSPLVYAGHWMETDHLTSGLVTEVTRESDRGEGAVGDEYKVRIHGVEVTIYPSDFLEYEVDDRVGIVKRNTVTVNSTETSFAWGDITVFAPEDKDTEQTEYIIIPIAFFQEGE